MSTSGPSAGATAAAADAISRLEFDDELPRDCTWEGLARGHEETATVALTAAYAVDEPRIRAEVRAEMRDEIVAWLRGIPLYTSHETRIALADAIERKFADTPDPDKEDA